MCATAIVEYGLSGGLSDPEENRLEMEILFLRKWYCCIHARTISRSQRLRILNLDGQRAGVEG